MSGRESVGRWKRAGVPYSISMGRESLGPATKKVNGPDAIRARESAAQVAGIRFQVRFGHDCGNEAEEIHSPKHLFVSSFTKLRNEVMFWVCES